MLINYQGFSFSGAIAVMYVRLHPYIRCLHGLSQKRLALCLSSSGGHDGWGMVANEAFS